jgi:tetratricopeptide (TPR) repeat protein
VGASAVEAFALRVLAEVDKQCGNDFYASAQYEQALNSYNKAMQLVITRTVSYAELGEKIEKFFGSPVLVPLRQRLSPLDKRMLAVLHSNCSACHLAMGNAETALAEARKAIAADPGFEKGFLRLAAALEALDRRAEALDAYERISSNAVAAGRIAALQTPRVVFTAEGVTGVPEASLDPSQMALFPKPEQFFRNRIYLPSEPLKKFEPRYLSHEYSLRMFVQQLADYMLEKQTHEHAVIRHAFVDEKNSTQVWVDVMGRFLALPNVVEDGRSRKLSRHSSVVPVVMVALWTGKGAPPGAQITPGCWGDVERLRAMLLRNARLLSEEGKRGYYAPKGFVLSLLTHVAVPELDYSVHEGCCVSDCAVECAPYRCGRCFLTRYCGKEHMAAHWKSHKPKCVPLAQRQPTVVLDCSEDYLDNPEKAEALGIDCVVVPRKTFPGLTVVKMQVSAERKFRICDPHGVFVLFVTGEHAGYRSMAMPFAMHATLNGLEGVGYFDADMSMGGAWCSTLTAPPGSAPGE